MQHNIAVKIAQIVNDDFARIKCRDYFAYVCKQNEGDLAIVDDWFVKISEKQ